MSRTIIVTGASSGIGAETTRLLRKAGARVIGVDRSETSAADLHLVADLSSEAGVRSVIERLDGQYDGLCNIAGVPGTAPAEAVLNINVLALRALTTGILPALRAGASIVNLASQAGAAWRDDLPLIREFLRQAPWGDTRSWAAENLPAATNAYAFSKECVIVLTQMQAADALGRDVRINSVSPGPVETPILDDFRRDLGQEKTAAAREAVGRWGTPADVASVVVALLDPSVTGWVNGANIPTDGGLGASRFAQELQGTQA